jgi:peptide/nickel transport system substrate-binding protein
MTLDRRTFTKGATAWVAAPSIALLLTPRAVAAPKGTLIVAQANEPVSLTNAMSTEGNIYPISSKIFDGLLTFDAQRRPQPRLATAWDVSRDGLTVTLDLRAGVKWHDGQPFSSADVAFSVLELWRKYNGRGRSTFANVERVDTPTPQRVVLRLTKPAPYLLTALSSIESQVLPRHLYEGSNPLINPRNAAPVGTGPFRFVRRQRGSLVQLERNPDYWDPNKPKIEQLVFRFVPDLNAASAALETGEAHLAVPSLANVERLRANPLLAITTFDEPFSAGITAFEFNLDRPVLRDVRVRHAFAHAIDKNFLLKNVFHGLGHVAESAIPPTMTDFYTGDVPTYAFDVKKAEALLDAAGLKPNAQGVRLTLACDPNPIGALVQVAQVVRASLSKIGVRLEVRNQDFAEYVNRLYTRRDWDTAIVGGSMGPDPAIGTQRWYWSKNFRPGVAFSNGAHYESAEADAALEAGQTELDPARRREQYHRFQRVVQTDLPRIPLIASTTVVASHRSVCNFVDSAEGLYGNFGAAELTSATPAKPLPLSKSSS